MAVVVDAAVDGGNDAVGERHPEGLAQGIADRGDVLAHGELAAVAEDRRLEPLRVDLQHRDIAHGIGADKHGLKASVVKERHGRAVAVFHHVGIGQDQTVLRQDDAAAPEEARAAVDIAADGDDGLRAVLVELLQAELPLLRVADL